MFGEMLDTSERAQRFYFEHLARMTPLERLALMDSSSRMIRVLAEATIHREEPNCSPADIRARAAARLYGRELVERVLGPLPEHGQ